MASTTIHDWMLFVPNMGKRWARGLYDEVSAAYMQPHRMYHTISHIHCMLKLLGNMTADQFWATWYHDFFYDPLARDNEERSAEIAAARLRTIGVDSTNVVRMILATKTHAVDRSRSTETLAFLDADMAILGQPPEVYRTYAELVRQEYHMVPDELYRTGRLVFLNTTIDAPEIYGTQTFKDRYEKQAEVNLIWERDYLQQQ